MLLVTVKSIKVTVGNNNYSVADVTETPLSFKPVQIWRITILLPCAYLQNFNCNTHGK